ncbi:cytochrome c oxidase assembly protein [Novosphingobium panipatense]|uniref:cytochrome c oxidase assembly protein n=1 Tax=Novosphingobium TaxID=165696 RepID=UPI000CDA6E9D|nr:cytochrome c oxidase assembly protein [Novosphingobium sp. HII-3]
MKRAALLAGLVLLPIGWGLSGIGMTGHMAGHMIAVAVSAPLLAYGLSGSSMDPAHRWPLLASPMTAMLLELVTVWTWHLPALRAAAHGSILVSGLEHACFLAAGLFLWTAAIHAPNRASGIGALLLTSMHMTLLGVLIGLAPRPLYAGMHHAPGLDYLSDQQLGGVVMLIVGGVSYLAGGLVLLGALLKEDRSEAA